MMQGFYRPAALLTIILLIVLFLIDRYAHQIELPAVLYFFVLAFSALTAGIHNWLTRANERNPKLFVTYFLGSVSIKLFATLIFLVVYIFLNRDEKVAVGLGVFAIYASFTVIEIVSLYKKITS